METEGIDRTHNVSVLYSLFSVWKWVVLCKYCNLIDSESWPYSFIRSAQAGVIYQVMSRRLNYFNQRFLGSFLDKHNYYYVKMFQ